MRDNDRIKDWFEQGKIWIQDPGDPEGAIPVTLDPTQGGEFKDRPLSWHRRRLITPFAKNFIVPDRYMMIASPVELVIEDPSSGQRYTTDPALAGVGDIVLPKAPIPLIDSQEDGDPAVELPDFPPYSIDLPQSLHGALVDLEVIGIGNGSFTVSYLHRGDDFVASPAISGTIANGQTLSGMFAVQPAGAIDPKITSFAKIGANQYRIEWSPSSTVTIQFSTSLSAGSWENVGTVTGGSFWEGGAPLPAPSKGFFRLSTP